MRWSNLVLAALVSLCLLAQNVRIRKLETQLDVLKDTVQRQEMKLRELQPISREEPEKTYEEIARKVFGHFDDHDVSGLLEDW